MSALISSAWSFRFIEIPEREFLHLPFEGKAGQLFAEMMKFYNRRLVTLAKRRLATGCYGRRNAGWRELYDGFVPDRRVGKLIRKGLFHWWRAELTNLRLILTPGPAAARRVQTTAHHRLWRADASRAEVCGGG